MWLQSLGKACKLESFDVGTRQEFPKIQISLFGRKIATGKYFLENWRWSNFNNWGVIGLRERTSSLGGDTLRYSFIIRQQMGLLPFSSVLQYSEQAGSLLLITECKNYWKEGPDIFDLRSLLFWSVLGNSISLCSVNSQNINGMSLQVLEGISEFGHRCKYWVLPQRTFDSSMVVTNSL